MSDDETTTTEPVTTATEQPTAVDYAEQFLDLVAHPRCIQVRLDERITRLDTEVDSLEQLWAELRGEVQPMMAEWAESLIGLNEGLVAHSWPEDVQPDIDALIVETEPIARHYFQAAQASTTDDFYALQQQEMELASSNMAIVIAVRLGIPPDLGDVDWCAEAESRAAASATTATSAPADFGTSTSDSGTYASDSDYHSDMADTVVKVENLKTILLDVIYDVNAGVLSFPEGADHASTAIQMIDTHLDHFAERRPPIRHLESHAMRIEAIGLYREGWTQVERCFRTDVAALCHDSVSVLTQADELFAEARAQAELER